MELSGRVPLVGNQSLTALTALSPLWQCCRRNNCCARRVILSLPHRQPECCEARDCRRSLTSALADTTDCHRRAHW